MPQWVTQQKFMEETGLDYGAVRCWRAAGLIPAIKMRGKWMLDIEAFNDNLRQKANTRARVTSEPLTLHRGVIDFDEHLRQRRQKLRDEKRQDRQRRALLMPATALIRE